MVKAIQLTIVTLIVCIEEFDKYIGTLINYLKETDDPNNEGSLYDNTLIIFTSDNGPGREGATGALRGRKGTTFEGGMKVPLIVSWPNGNIGTNGTTETFYYYEWTGGGSDSSSVDGVTTSEMVKSETATPGTTVRITSSAMNIDLFTTILSAVGIDKLPSDRIIDGVDLMDLWTGEIASDTAVHDVLVYLKGGRALAVQVTDVETVDGTFDFKYYESVHSENSAFFDQFYNNYLFNLDTDPIEGYNVSMIYPDVAEMLNEILNEFRAEMKTNRRGIIT